MSTPGTALVGVALLAFRMLGCWDAGMLGCWDAGMLGCWDAGGHAQEISWDPWGLWLKRALRWGAQTGGYERSLTDTRGSV